ncbi:zinc-binding dehydrogenase [Tessaracoccus sp. MC1756]|uniref:zinc-dependent alcohol dehydrogenase n=1 Tax=Tessaracoccus sp. MC1756 TaxID=2760311 RepID=UPI0015FFA6BC|nr:zinc-binding dehydrogenase [Tessaracoccus sp. MC1756]MBB1510943.1 zinc-binding dehydrogenase [Tessaracoccus sp. MC1756]
MKALQFLDKDKPEVSDIDVPQIAADEVLIAARSVGICHSDIELLEGRYIIPFEYPIIPGHEWAGEVVAVGDDVTDLKPGDRVVGECVIGEDHFGFSISGAIAEFFVARPEWLHKIPESIDYASAALIETFTVGYYALLEVGNVNAADTVAVLGAGPVGLVSTAAAAAMGATVVTIEPSEKRREAAIKLGATHAVAPDEAEALLSQLTDGAGPSVVVEASGNPKVMAEAIRIAGHGARLAFIGINVGDEASAPLGLIQSKALKIVGTIGSVGVWPDAIRFLERTGIDLSPLVTEEFDLEQAVEALSSSRDSSRNLKVQVRSTSTL